MRVHPIALAIGVWRAATSGCVTGPVRWKVLGDWRFAARAWPDETRPPCGALAVACGTATDIGLVVADTVVVPIAAVGVAGFFGLYGPDPKPNEVPPGLICFPLGLLYFLGGIVASPVTCWMLSYGWDVTPMPEAEATPSAPPTPTASRGPLPPDDLRE